MKQFRNLYVCAVFLLLAIAASAGSARANTAAGVVISNTATLSYNGTTTTSQVSVTVALKQSAPNITITGGNSSYSGVNSPSITQTVIVVATANGPSTYRVSTAASNQNNNSSSGSVNIQGPNNYSAAALNYIDETLGATVTTGTSGQTYVTVPRTTGASTTSINGISAGATPSHIMVGAHEVTVTNIVDQGDTFQIQWSGAIPLGDVPGPGQVIGEKKVLNFYAYPGTVQSVGSNISFDVNATASNTVNGNTVSATTSSPANNSWTTNAPTVSFTKYVRNVSDSTATGGGGTASATFGANTYTYYHDSVTAKPTETLEYLIVAINTDPTNPLTGCAIGDVLPIPTYAAFVSNAYGANNDIAYFDTTGALSYFQTYGSGTHQAMLVSPNLLNVKVGDTASDTQGGNVPVSRNVKILYRLTIN